MEDFFKVLYAGCSGYVNVRAIKDDVIKNEFIELSKFDQAAIKRKYLSYNLFFGVATRDGVAGAKENVVSVPAVWVDIDFKDISKEIFDKGFPAFTLKPSMVITSGGGYHIYWKLKNPLDKTSVEKLEDILKRLASYLKGDSKAAEMARVLRFPNSINYKYSPLRDVIVSEVNDNQYSLTDFDFLPKIKLDTSKSYNDIGWYLDSLKGVAHGEREVTAAKLAGRYLAKGLSPNETAAILELWNRGNTPPLERAKIESTVKSINKAEIRKEPETTSHHVKNISSCLKETIAKGVTGIDPGYSFLRKTVRYIRKGHLWIAGGYTSVGKSFFISDLLMRVMDLTPDVGIAVFSTEMSKDEYMIRFLANRSNINAHFIQENKIVSSGQKDLLSEAYGFLEIQNLWLYDDLYKFEEIAKEAEKIKKSDGLDIVVIDFIQNLQGKGSIYERMSYLSPYIQQVAKQLQVCMIVLSQVSNEAAKADLEIIGYKGAGEIAAAADLALWLERDDKDDQSLEMIVRKNRHGAKGKTMLRYDDNWTRLEET